MMEKVYSTKQVAHFLKVKPDTLCRAVWQDKVDAPEKMPGGAFGWTKNDINRASWVLRRRDASDVFPELNEQPAGRSVLGIFSYG